jgi:hypothetical protein
MLGDTNALNDGAVVGTVDVIDLPSHIVKGPVA